MRLLPPWCRGGAGPVAGVTRAACRLHRAAVRPGVCAWAPPLCVFLPLCACGSWVIALVASEGNFLGCPWRRVSARLEYLSLSVFCAWPPIPAAWIQHSRNLT